MSCDECHCKWWATAIHHPLFIQGPRCLKWWQFIRAIKIYPSRILDVWQFNLKPFLPESWLRLSEHCSYLALEATHMRKPSFFPLKQDWLEEGFVPPSTGSRDFICFFHVFSRIKSIQSTNRGWRFFSPKLSISSDGFGVWDDVFCSKANDKLFKTPESPLHRWVCIHIVGIRKSHWSCFKDGTVMGQYANMLQNDVSWRFFLLPVDNHVPALQGVLRKIYIYIFIHCCITWGLKLYNWFCPS